MINEYLPFISSIIEVKKHTEIEYTFRMTYEGHVKPGQFFQVSLPKFGEAPISVSGINEGSVDLTIRKVGKVTNEVFNNYAGNKLFLRGPYGNGFNIDDYKNKELIIVAGGTGLSPVKALVDYFSNHKDETNGFTLIVGFKSPNDIIFKGDIEDWCKKTNVILTVDKQAEGYSGNVGLVTEYIPKLKINDLNTAQVIVVGPPIMMKFAVQGFLNLNIKEENIWISHERKMCCGIGKCGHCRISDSYVCLDGPVYNYSMGKFLVD